MKVVGVDGCKNSLFARITVDEKLSSAHVFDSFSVLVDVLADAKIIAVDIPIGLLDDTIRQADVEAKHFLGKRASSVYSTTPPFYIRAILVLFRINRSVPALPTSASALRRHIEVILIRHLTS